MDETMASPEQEPPAAEDQQAADGAERDAGATGEQGASAPAQTAEDPAAAADPDDAPAGPAPLGVERQPTGNAEVDGYLGRLADADQLTPDGHTEVYEDVHRGLRSTLAGLDSHPGPPPPGPHPAPPR
ncbi:hypothetical protein [Streptomyces physcomitrii]|nr:hypothetical protein [Streptomyces physcomitrii]